MKLRFSRAAVLGVVLAGQLVFYVGLQIGARFPMEHRGVPGESPLIRWRRAQLDSTREIKLGSSAPAVPGVSAAGHRATALVFLGDRDDCGTRSLIASWRHAVGRCPGLQAVFVAQRFDAALRLPCEGKQRRPQIVLDPGGAVARKFNAAWTPRAYVLDARGAVAYIQSPTTPDSRASDEALHKLGLPTAGPINSATGP